MTPDVKRMIDRVGFNESGAIKVEQTSDQSIEL